VRNASPFFFKEAGGISWQPQIMIEGNGVELLYFGEINHKLILLIKYQTVKLKTGLLSK